MHTSTLLIPIVSAAAEDLNDAELAALNEAVQTGRDPRLLDGDAQLRDLFTENGGAVCTARRASRWSWLRCPDSHSRDTAESIYPFDLTFG